MLKSASAVAGSDSKSKAKKKKTEGARKRQSKASAERKKSAEVKTKKGKTKAHDNKKKQKKSEVTGKKQKAKSNPKKKNKKLELTPATADRHTLYEQSVQAPDVDSKFLAHYYKKTVGRPIQSFREDFCGTFTLSCHMVDLGKDINVIGVDLDGPTLDWGREHNLSKLSEEQQSRVSVVQDNVLNVVKPKVDMVAAMNFSYSIFKERKSLGAYFKTAFRSLNTDGLLVLDVWGGSETQVLQEEEREIDGFTYVWDQFDFDPLTYHSVCKIHFDFPNGERMEDAFVYDWRLWTIPELRELMEEAGFEDVHVLWEGTDKKTNEGNGVYKRVKRGDPDDAWIAYLVGQKPS